MKKWLQYSAATLATVLIAAPTFAQDQKDIAPKSKKEKSEEIVIRKKGDKSEKMTIVVDGDNVTINGKPVDEFKNEDVTILRRDRLMPPPPPRAYGRGGSNIDIQRFEELAPARANKAMLGVATEKVADGAQIISVTKESGAEKAGLKKDDIITKVGSTKIEDPEDLINVIRELKPADKVDVTYKRDGKENKTSATLGQNKATAYSFNMNSDDFNVNIPRVDLPNLNNFNFNFNMKPKIGLQIQDVEEGKGVTVKDVDEDSPAAKAGFKEGDVITQVNGSEVVGVDDLRSRIKEVKEGDTIKVNYKRNGKNESADIKIPKRLKTADL